MSTNLPVDLLRLSGLTAVATVEENGNLIVTCHGPRVKPAKCCSESEWSDNHHEKARFRDFTIQGQPVWLKVERKKWKCSECDAGYTEHVPITQDRKTPRFATDRFVKAIALDSTDTTFSAAAIQHGVHESFVRRVFDDYATPKMKNYTPAMPRVLGIDEKYIKGVPHFVIGDVEHSRLLEILPSNKIDEIRKFFEPLKDRDNVQIVCQDMYPGYRNIVPEFFPNARVVIDKWHVLRAVNRGVRKARRYAKKKIIHSLQIDLFIDEPVNDQSDRLAKDLEGKGEHLGFLVRHAIYQQKLFYDIYNTKDGSLYADKLISKFVIGLSTEMRKIFSKLMRALQYNRKGIIYYFDDPFTNAYIERLNGLIGTLERNASGLRYNTLRAKALLSYGHLKSEPQYCRIPGPSRPRRPRNPVPISSQFLTTGSSDEMDSVTGVEPDWAAMAPRGGADLDILTAVLETGTL